MEQNLSNENVTGAPESQAKSKKKQAQSKLPRHRKNQLETCSDKSQIRQEESDIRSARSQTRNRQTQSKLSRTRKAQLQTCSEDSQKKPEESHAGSATPQTRNRQAQSKLSRRREDQLQTCSEESQNWSEESQTKPARPQTRNWQAQSNMSRPREEQPETDSKATQTEPARPRTRNWQAQLKLSRPWEDHPQICSEGSQISSEESHTGSSRQITKNRFLSWLEKKRAQLARPVTRSISRVHNFEMLLADVVPCKVPRSLRKEQQTNEQKTKTSETGTRHNRLKKQQRRSEGPQTWSKTHLASFKMQGIRTWEHEFESVILQNRTKQVVDRLAEILPLDVPVEEPQVASNDSTQVRLYEDSQSSLEVVRQDQSDMLQTPPKKRQQGTDEFEIKSIESDNFLSENNPHLVDLMYSEWSVFAERMTLKLRDSLPERRAKSMEDRPGPSGSEYNPQNLTKTQGVSKDITEASHVRSESSQTGSDGVREVGVFELVPNAKEVINGGRDELILKYKTVKEPESPK